MSKHICEKCGKEFKNYTAHKNRKTPCDKNLDKKKLGQFYTTNYNYILKNMVIPDEIKNIIEPFVGNGDLLKFIEDKKKYNIECYDIDTKTDYTIKRDTLNNPPDYNNKFILTNPPYLERNKNLIFIFR